MIRQGNKAVVLPSIKTEPLERRDSTCQETAWQEKTRLALWVGAGAGLLLSFATLLNASPGVLIFVVAFMLRPTRADRSEATFRARLTCCWNPFDAISLRGR